jgi:hypothetical protein
MKPTVIAVRGGDKLVYTHDSFKTGVARRMGYVLMKNGSKIDVMIDSVLSRGYWEPPTEEDKPE